MKNKLLILLLLALPSTSMAGSWDYEYEALLNNYYGYTDYAKSYNKLHKQNNLNSSLNLFGRASYEFNSDYTASLIGYFMIDSAKEIENYNQGKWGEEVYLLTETPLGDISLGQDNNVAYNFAVGAPNVGAYHINNTELTNFITNPNWYKKGHTTRYKTLNSTYINTDGNSLKANYITPEFYGIKLGATYIPKTYSQSGLVAKKAEYKNEKAYVLGAYGGWDILDYELETSLGFADYDKNDKEYSLGASIYHKGWTFGASYRKTKASTEDYSIDENTFFDSYRDGRAYNIGLSYTFGPITSGVAYFDSKAEKSSNHDKIISLSNKYQYNRHTALSLTLAHLKSIGEDSGVKNNSKGFAFIFGLEFNL